MLTEEGSALHQVRIELNTAATSGGIYIDDKRIHGVRAIEYKAGVGDAATVTITLVPKAVEITGLGEVCRRYAKLDPADARPYYDDEVKGVQP